MGAAGPSKASICPGEQGVRGWAGGRRVAHGPGWAPGTAMAAAQRRGSAPVVAALQGCPSAEPGREGGPRLHHAAAGPGARRGACMAAALAPLLVMPGPKNYA